MPNVIWKPERRMEQLFVFHNDGENIEMPLPSLFVYRMNECCCYCFYLDSPTMGLYLVF